MRYSDESWENYYEQMECFDLDETYIVAGAGNGLKVLLKEFPTTKIECILDKNPNIVNNCSYSVFSYNHLLSLEGLSEKKIIITPGTEFYREIKEALIKYGAKKENICSLNELLLFWGYKYHHKIMISEIAMLLHNYCNLKCKSCSHLLDHCNNNHWYNTLDEAKKYVDYCFNVFDYIKELVLCGGETFIYKELPELVQYVHEKYGNRYQMLSVFTNGTLIPNDEYISRLSIDDKLIVKISVYKSSDKIEQLVKKMDNFHINYMVNAEFGQDNTGKWYDFGNPYIKKDGKYDHIKDKYVKCSLNCYHYINGNMYICPIQGTAHEMKFHDFEGTDFYLNLNSLNKVSKEDKFKTIAKYCLGFLDNEYLPMCEYCNGYGDEVNKKMVNAGEQKV